jgi:hypothetical protein
VGRQVGIEKDISTECDQPGKPDDRKNSFEPSSKIAQHSRLLLDRTPQIAPAQGNLQDQALSGFFCWATALLGTGTISTTTSHPLPVVALPSGPALGLAQIFAVYGWGGAMLTDTQWAA